MALKKLIEIDNTGISGEYWKIMQDNFSEDRKDGVVTIQLYVSQAGREEGKSPLPESRQFNFIDGDHPLSELNPESIDTDLVVNAVKGESWFRSFRLHCLYQHIKAISVIARAKQDVIDESEHPENETELTRNEKLALFFFDADDIL